MTANTNTQAVEPIDPRRVYTVLICDLVGLRFGPDGKPDPSEVRAHIEAKGGRFHATALGDKAGLEQGRVHFFYQPDLSTREELIEAAGDGRYDAVIAAATFLPAETVFPLAGVRIGAGTGNMGSRSWGGGSGEGGTAVLMNTPGINSRATAQMVLKAILKVLPDLPVDRLHDRVAHGAFDTGRELRDFPTEKLEGKTIAIIGYGNIGREVAKLARAFGMRVVIHARPRHRDWIEAEGFAYAADLGEAAEGADVLSVHVGLGKQDAQGGRYANAGLIGADVLSRMNKGAVLVNYDRGELVDVAALGDALDTGQVRHAAIDADLFKDASTGSISGPMLPYLDLVEKHGARLELLPHAAADTDHPSRVAGARQAVDQIFDAICRKSVTNAKGTVPEGYLSLGVTTPPGIGPVTARNLRKLTADDCSELAGLCERQAQLWKALSIALPERRGKAIAEQGEELIRLTNRFCTLAENLNLRGPYQ